MVPLPIAVSTTLCLCCQILQTNGTFLNGFRSCLPPAWFPSGPDQCAVNDKVERGSTILDPYLHSLRRGLMAMTKCGYNPVVWNHQPEPQPVQFYVSIILPSSTSPCVPDRCERPHVFFGPVWVSLVRKKVEDLNVQDNTITCL